MAPSEASFPQAISSDQACWRCGYNLRGLDPFTRCPECGHPVADTIARQLAQKGLLRPLDQADPRWIKKILESIVLLLASVALAIPAFVMMLLRPNVHGWHPRVELQVLYLGLFSIPWTMVFLAAWKIGAREPGAPSGDRLALRWALRATAVIWLVTPLLVNPSWRRYAVGESLFGLLAAAPAAFLMLSRLAAVARRVPNRGLARELLALGIVAAVFIPVEVSFFQTDLNLLGSDLLRADDVFIGAPGIGAALPWGSLIVGYEMVRWDWANWWRLTRRESLALSVISLKATLILWQMVLLARLMFGLRRARRALKPAH